MMASEFLYDNILSTVTTNYPLYIGADADTTESYISILDVGGSSNPAYLRDTYYVDFIARAKKQDYSVVMTDLLTIRDAILGHPNIVDSDGNIWCRYILSQGPKFSHIDDFGRMVITMIFEVTVDSLNGVHRKTIQ